MLRPHGIRVFTCDACGYSTSVPMLADDDVHLGVAYFYKDASWVDAQRDHNEEVHGAHRDSNGCVTGGPTWTARTTANGG